MVSFSLKIEGRGYPRRGGGAHRCREDICKEERGANFFFRGRNSHQALLFPLKQGPLARFVCIAWRERPSLRGEGIMRSAVVVF